MKLKIKVAFLWFDLWMGFFYNRTKKVLYFCPIPMMVFSFRLEEKLGSCSFCERELQKTAYMDEGWILEVGCDCGNSDFIDWPFGDKELSGEDLEELGYIIV